MNVLLVMGWHDVGSAPAPPAREAAAGGADADCELGCCRCLRYSQLALVAE
ncbi:MAG TPA: hypothetical protein VFG30_35570 [Polyangiales bacterium]|nr:hypothetical protein [Polyangiales bacterium]